MNACRKCVCLSIRFTSLSRVASAYSPHIFLPRPWRSAQRLPGREHTSGVRIGSGCYNAGMTLVEVTYELQAPLRAEQLRALGQFANLYGLRRFRVDEERNQLSFEYDASRLTETEVAQALRKARIAVGLRV